VGCLLAGSRWPGHCAGVAAQVVGQHPAATADSPGIASRAIAADSSGPSPRGWGRGLVVAVMRQISTAKSPLVLQNRAWCPNEGSRMHIKGPQAVHTVRLRVLQQPCPARFNSDPAKLWYARQ
jgi:hypothetical protein